MEGYIIQEYNRRTKKFRDLGVISAKNKQEAKSKFIEVSDWKPTKELLLHVQAPSEYNETQRTK